MRIRLLCVAALTLALASCGGAGSSPSGGGPVAPPLLATLLPDIPAGGHFVPQKATSASVAQRSGASADTVVGGSVQVGAMALASQPNDVAYAIYRFTGVPGESISAAGFAGSGLTAGGNVWLGIGDYTTRKWDFQNPSSTGSASYNVDSAPGRYTSSGGDTYLLVVLFGGDNFSIDTVSLTYGARHSVAGQVRDSAGAPVPGATVSTPLYNFVTITDASGNFTLGGLPDGDWPLVATKDGWTFYDNPQAATISGADASGVTFIGHQHNENYLPPDSSGNDNSLGRAATIDLSGGPMAGSLSIVDDQDDFYRTTITAPGTYWLELRNPPGDILFPLLEVFNADGVNMATSFFALAGHIRVPVYVVSAPQDILIHASLGGGGGNYELELGTGVVHALTGFVGIDNKPQNPVSFARVHAVPASGGYTDYLTDTGGNYADSYRAGEQTTVTAITDMYAFTPASVNVDLSTADREAKFTPVPGSFTDSREPNNTLALADANASLTLPYNSVTAGNSLVIDPSPDAVDYYRLSPASGQGVRVRLAAVSATEAAAMQLEICDSTGTAVSSTGKTSDGYEARLSAQSDGSAYYIKVSVLPSGNHKMKYTLNAESFTPYALTFKNMFGANASGGAQIELYDATFSWHRTLVAGTSGTTSPLLAAQDEQFYAELVRFGFDTHRHTRTFSMPPTAHQVVFTADPAVSLDQNEPNNDLFIGTLRSLPLSTRGTVDPVADPSDYYLVNASQNKPLEVTLDLAAGESLNLTLSNDGGIQQWNGTATGPTPVLLPVAMPGLQRLRVDHAGAEQAYQIQLRQADGKRIRGTVTDGAAPVASCRVYCPEVDRWVDTSGSTGNYDLGLFAPGSYTVQCFAPGYAVPADHTVIVATTDKVEDFTLTPAPFDANEPDNTPATAFGLPTDGTPTALRTVGFGADAYDFGKVTVTAGQLIELTVDRGEMWHYPPAVSVQNAAGNAIASLTFGETATGVLTVRLPSAGNYFVMAGGGPAEYALSVRLY